MSEEVPKTEEVTQQAPEGEEKPAEEQAEVQVEGKDVEEGGEKPSEEEATKGAEKPSEGATVAEGEEQPEQQEEEEEDEDDGTPRVLVTGASGYIATHVIQQLLRQGRFRVRGTVRSLKKEEKVKPLKELVPDAKYPLRLVEADLQKPDSWPKAVKGCSYVFHIASPFPLKPPRNENQVIQPAVDGTLNVLRACAEAGCVKRVVLTSCIAAVSNGTAGRSDHTGEYTEEDWSTERDLPAYEKSKLRAEKAAWNYMKELEEGKRFELAVVNPAVVLGPPLTVSGGTTSADVIKRTLLSKMTGIPNVNFPISDVRDVAAAHIASMEKPDAVGNRCILCAGTMWWRDMAQLMAREFKPQGYKVLTRSLPKFGMWVGKLFDPAAKQLYPTIGKQLAFNTGRMTGVLGIEPHPLEETIIDMCYALIELGIINKTAGYLGHPSTRPKAEQKTEGAEGEAKAEEEGEGKTEGEGEAKAEATEEQSEEQEATSEQVEAKPEETAPAEKPEEKEEKVPADEPKSEEEPKVEEQPAAVEEAQVEVTKTEEQPAAEEQHEEQKEEGGKEEDKPAEQQEQEESKAEAEEQATEEEQEAAAEEDTTTKEDEKMEDTPAQEEDASEQKEEAEEVTGQ